MYKINKPYNITNKLKSRREIFDGIEPKFWISIDETEYLYKYNPDFEDVTFGEVFISALCKSLGIKCVDASFAYGTVNGEKTKGCLVKSYIDDNIFENISLMRITDKLQEKWSILNNDCTRENTPDNIYEDLTNYLKGKNCEIDSSVLQDLKIMTLFDYVTAQIDRHEKNIEFLVTKEDGKLGIKLAPMFDNGRCFGFIFANAYEKKRDRANYVTGERSILVMDQNLCLNDNSICDCAFGIAKELSENPELYALFQRMENFDIQTFITNFMEETGEYVSSLREAQVVDTWRHRIEKINHAMQEYSKPEVRQQIARKVELNRRSEYIRKNELYETDFFVNFYFDKANNSKIHSLSEYIKQDEEYRLQLEKWENLEIDELKSVDDYSLLKKRCNENEKKYFMQKIIEDRFDRKREAREYKRNELVPDFFTLERLQLIKDIRSGKSDRNETEILEELFQKKVNFSRRLRDWVAYGDDLLKKPTFEDYGIDTKKKYDEAVVRKYIVDFEMEGHEPCDKYDRWVEKNNKKGLVEEANKNRYRW